MPELLPIVATDGTLLYHVPLPGSVSNIVAATQRAEGPPIAAGSGLTVITVVVEQPVLSV
jgi:hypothetical protein